MVNAADFTNISASRVLIVDSDVASRQKWSRMLEILGLKVSQAGSGEEALAQLELSPFDLTFFDLPLPDIGDPELLQQARQLSSEMLIIVQNNQPTIESTVAAIKVGATDYLIGLANAKFVVDTITAALRKQAREREHQSELVSQQVETYFESQSIERGAALDELPPDRQLVTCSGFQLNRQARRLTLREDNQEKHVELTKGEADVLASLMSRPGKAMSCRQIVRIAFRYESGQHEAQSVVRPYISRLRRKFEEAGYCKQPISTVRGRGYSFIESQNNNS